MTSVNRSIKFHVACLIVLVLIIMTKTNGFSYGHRWCALRPARASNVKINIHPFEIPCRNFAGCVDKSAPMLFYHNYGPNAPNRCDEIDIANTSLFDRFRKPAVDESTHGDEMKIRDEADKQELDVTS